MGIKSESMCQEKTGSAEMILYTGHEQRNSNSMPN